MKPTLSIIMPSLNQSPFIDLTIRSALRPSYENLEYPSAMAAPPTAQPMYWARALPALVGFSRGSCSPRDAS
jgi:hypothetical protein